VLELVPVHNSIKALCDTFSIGSEAYYGKHYPLVAADTKDFGLVSGVNRVAAGGTSVSSDNNKVITTYP
jgi:hypothetical protein